ncbi:MAG TPA: hypothetical protein VLB27_05155, partial [candidate division Zixibacteria bacterium]|nr:hypothetical protein [candidate division Zixibacteria bacterium]
MKFHASIAGALCLLSATLWAPPAFGQPRSIGAGQYESQFADLSGATTGASLVVVQFDPDITGGGLITVGSGTDREVQADVYLLMPADLRDMADQLMARFSATLRNTETGETQITLGGAVEELDSETRERLRYRVAVTVPEGVALEIEAPYAEVDINGRVGDVTIERTLAPVSIAGARGRLEVRGANSRVLITDLIGSFDIETSNDRVRLVDVRIDSSYQSASRRAHAETENADIEFVRYTGPFDLETTRGVLRGREVALTLDVGRLSNRGGEVDVRFAELAPEASLVVTNSYEEITLGLPAHVNARLKVQTSGGEVSIDGLEHRIDRVYRDRLEALF